MTVIVRDIKNLRDNLCYPEFRIRTIKTADENMVGNVSRRIIAALRNRQFFSLYEINQAISEELEKFIHRPFSKDGRQ